MMVYRRESKSMVDRGTTLYIRYVLDIIARTNPNTGHVQVVFLFERLACFYCTMAISLRYIPDRHTPYTATIRQQFPTSNRAQSPRICPGSSDGHFLLLGENKTALTGRGEVEIKLFVLSGYSSH